MHEQSIVEAIMALALENAGKENAKKIIRVYLVVGELSGVLQEAVEFYWRFLSKNTIAAGSELFFMQPPTLVRCRACGTEYTPENLKLVCPKCKERKVEILSGRELFIDNMEVE
jgi:hydrogenase nickel incorporation protein HypA/HybF